MGSLSKKKREEGALEEKRQVQKVTTEVGTSAAPLCQPPRYKSCFFSHPVAGHCVSSILLVT